MKVSITCGGIGLHASGDYLRRSIQAAERAGFSSYWLPDHVVRCAVYPESDYPYADGAGQDVPDPAPDEGAYSPMSDPRNAFVDPIVGMTWLAAATSRIEVGTNILVLPQRNPVILAKALATLDSFSYGRVVLGVGVGWAKEEFDAVGVDFAQRGRRTDEAVAAMRRLWSDDPSTFTGEFQAFKDVHCFPKPVRPDGIPILIGGESHAALRRVARLGDGWMPYNLRVEDAAAAIADLKRMTREQGRDPETLRIVKIVYAWASRDDLARYRDAGVTEFNVAANVEMPDEIPVDDVGMEAKMAELRERVVDVVAGW